MKTPPPTTATLRAYINTEWRSMHEVAVHIEDGRPESAINVLSFSSHDMSEVEGYLQVGTATVTVTFFPSEDMQAREMADLQAQLQKVRAENQLRENEILDRISKLQAIEYVDAAAS